MVGQKRTFAITAVKGVRQRQAHVVLWKAESDLTRKAGELTEDEMERVIAIMQNPYQYKIPDWFLNTLKDIKYGKKYNQVLAHGLDSKLWEDLQQWKRTWAHTGLQHFWGLRVQGQHLRS